MSRYIPPSFSPRDVSSQAVSLEGVEVDPTTLTVLSYQRQQQSQKPRPAAGVSAASAITGAAAGGSESGGVVMSGSRSPLTVALAAQSAGIYQRAEGVRALLEEEITDLLAEIVLPVRAYMCVCAYMNTYAYRHACA